MTTRASALKAAETRRRMAHARAQWEERQATPREFDVIPRRRWTLVAEWRGSRENGQRTARWFRDNRTGRWYVAESWKRPNLRRPLNPEQTAYVESVIA